MSEKMTGDSPIEHPFKNKGTAKTHAALPLASILLVQNSTDIGEAGVVGSRPPSRPVREV